MSLLLRKIESNLQVDTTSTGKRPFAAVVCLRESGLYFSTVAKFL